MTTGVRQNFKENDEILTKSLRATVHFAEDYANDPIA
jgi:hypothetical protein